MKTETFKKLIKEAVKEAFNEEFKEIILEAIKPKNNIINESFNPQIPNSGKRELTPIERKKAFGQIFEEMQKGNPITTDKIFTPTPGYNPAIDELPEGEVDLSSISNLLNK